MNLHSWTRGAFILPAALFTLAGLQPLAAQLPTLGEYPWTGYFAGYSSKHSRTGPYSNGDMHLTVLVAKEEPVMPKLVIPIVVAIEETLPGGKTVKLAMEVR